MYNNPNFVKVKKRFLNKHTQVSIFLHIHVSEKLKSRKRSEKIHPSLGRHL